ncbi:MAG: Gfo/Idh/MocA family oxidoreductase, partial [Patescibacteria group bacterium]
MKKKLKVGIAGYGVVGKKRRAFIDANLNFVTVAVSDVNFEKDHTASDGVRCFNSYKKIIKEDLDVLFVCLPNYLAPEATIG